MGVKHVFVAVLVVITLVETAHLNYHYQNCPKPQVYVDD